MSLPSFRTDVERAIRNGSNDAGIVYAIIDPLRARIPINSWTQLRLAFRQLRHDNANVNVKHDPK